MVNGRKSEIGTDKYFLEISKGTIFDNIRMTNGEHDFTNCLRDIAERAAKALDTIFEDLERNRLRVPFMENRQISGLEKLADQLYETTRFIPVSTRRTLNDIKNKLKSLALPSRYSMREVQEIAEGLKKGVRYNTPPYKKIDKELIAIASAYNSFDKYRSNTGANGKILGTDEYSKETGRYVFGGGFARSFDFNHDKSYKDRIQRQTGGIIDKIRSDVRSKRGTDEYMEHDARERVLKIAGELSKYCSGNPASWLDKDLEALRRLEDYNNNVIEIDRTGSSYPVDAELVWEKGENKLKLKVRVYYGKKLLSVDLKPTEPDPVAKPPLVLPSVPSAQPGPGPDYDPVAEAQNRAALEEARRAWKEAQEKAARKYREDVAKRQAAIDADFESRKRAAETEFKEWGSSTPYSVFKDQKVYVSVEIQEVSSKSSDAVTIFFDSPKESSMSWGGVTSGLVSRMPNWADLGIFMIDWRPNTPKMMFLKENHFSPNEETGVKEYHGIARHEFGHTLGLGDAYDAPYIPLLYQGNGADLSLPSLKGYNGDMAMFSNGSVQAKEIEMVILAFSTGKRQNFGKQAFYQRISDALLKENQ